MAKLEQKSVTYEIKAISTTDQGTVEALVSIFGNIDLGGDRIIAGAFSKSLERWKASGDPLPFIWSHEWDNPEAHIGFIKQAEERPEGLWVKAQLDIDRPFAEQVFHLLKNRRITQFSFGYTVSDARNVKDQDGTSVRELLEVDIFEAGPTLLGMNPATQLLQAASALKAMPEEVRPGLFAEWDSSGGTARGRIEYVMTEGTLGVSGTDFSIEASEEDPAVLLRIYSETDEGYEPTEMMVGHLASELRMIDELESDSKTIEVKAVEVPEYVAENAKRGLDYLEQGYGGDGLEDATIADARQLAAGTASDEKVAKIGPWIDRHIVDLEASQNSDPQDENYPGPGLVAMLLWGAGPDVEGAMRTRDWARSQSEMLDETASQSKEIEIAEQEKNENSNSQKELEQAARDSGAKISQDQIINLITRPQHSEE